jgi:hypothetical protein
VPLAAAAAMHYCDAHNIGPPRWVVTATTKILCAALDETTPKKRGRSNGLVTRVRQDTIDYVRWHMVMQVCEWRILTRQKLANLRKRAARMPAQRVCQDIRVQEALLDAIGADKFECASKLLFNTAAMGGRHAVRKSYRAVQKHERVGTNLMRYYSFDHEFLREVGFDVASFGRDKKMYELLDLKT